MRKKINGVDAPGTCEIEGREMLLIIGALFVVPGTIAAIIDDRKKVKWAAWIAVYIGMAFILFGFGGPAAIRDAIEF
ncbi:MAG TPA: hypothetical protein QGI07_01305 [Dehalococcoidia bacterium]|jgi:hypothetical protein|nr:hypothetical protein [Chloroflexota bacterium]MDP5877195.1 hypothetical protein [Dehalococcoidia bacterium]MDP6273244.1 hypothetical protein [Dehalococcoidia bacterium]MDP7160506.1 hypothetical protein [Dehalococcoidia bacterium]MDP7213107.1 hypothetical protein [Dehalococcoidia bacterium]|tara:strand:+ start:3062 stop:3292 length:231 start_codon:yes stop_codon:yes gene_type:complete